MPCGARSWGRRGINRGWIWLIRSPTPANPHQKNCIFVESTDNNDFDDWHREGTRGKLVWLTLRTCLWIPIKACLSFPIKTICLESKVPTTKYGYISISIPLHIILLSSFDMIVVVDIISDVVNIQLSNILVILICLTTT
jgi:hypothetical protein